MKEHTRYKLLLWLIALMTIPFFFVVNMPRSWGFDEVSVSSMALYGSAVFGYIGVSLIMWQLILGTRAISGLFFADLPAKLKLHRWLGQYGILVFLLHPLLILVAYSESLVYTIVPNFSTTYETAVTYGRFALMAMAIIWITSVAVRGKVAYRPWKYIHYLSYAIIVLSLLHVPAVGSSFSQPWVQFYWYSFVSIMLVAVALRMRHLFGFGKVAYRVSNLRQLTGDAFAIQVEPLEKNLSPRIGQYVYLQRNLRGEEHPFTVLDYEPESGKIMVAFKVSGRFSKSLAQSEVGETLLVDGPYGTFTEEYGVDPSTPSVFIAGGIGVTPFVKHVLRSQDGEQPIMLYANQSRQTAVYRDILRTTLGNRYVDILSKAQTPEEQGGNVEYGRISPEIIAKYVQNPTEKRYFICGPQGLIDAAKRQLAQLGVPKNQVYAEEFGF